MLYIENKYLPPDYVFRLYLSMLKDKSGKPMLLTANQRLFLFHLLSYPAESIEHEREFLDVIEAISSQQKAQQKQDYTL